MEERRASSFIQRLSYIVVAIAGFGGMYVLIDPIFSITVFGQAVKIGGAGFSEQLKGAVVQSLLIGGWTTLIVYWFGQSASGQEQQKTVSRIAEQSAPTSAAAAASATAAASVAPPPPPVSPPPPEGAQP